MLSQKDRNEGDPFEFESLSSTIHSKNRPERSLDLVHLKNQANLLLKMYHWNEFSEFIGEENSLVYFKWISMEKVDSTFLRTSNLVLMNSASLGSRKNVECFQTPECTWIYLITSMFVTKVGDEMYWWQLKDVVQQHDVTNITVTVYLRLLWLKTLIFKLND